MRATEIKLNELPTVNINTGKPKDSMTDEIWQKQFQIIKILIPPSKSKKMTVKEISANVNNNYAKDDTDTVTPIWIRYRNYINDVLDNIREGNKKEIKQIDYCYYIYQIVDLLRYEHDRLNTKYIQDEGYFEVWLED